MVPEIKVSLSHRGSPLASLEPPVAVGSGTGQLISALQEVAHRTNALLTEIITSGAISSSSIAADEDDDESSEDDSADVPPETKKKRS